MELYNNKVLIKSRLYDGLYETETNENDETKQYCYVEGSFGITAVAINSNNQNDMYYLLRDHQGSIMGLVNDQRTLVEEYSYDAWGRRRNPSDWTYDDVPAPVLMYRGYTMHEMLDDFALINMNGRCYDPIVGRFLSPDIVVQDGNNTQCYNKYSYCLNNPLKYNDPSGWSWEAIRALRRANELYLGAQWRLLSYNVNNWRDDFKIVGCGSYPSNDNTEGSVKLTVEQLGALLHFSIPWLFGNPGGSSSDISDQEDGNKWPPDDDPNHGDCGTHKPSETTSNKNTLLPTIAQIMKQYSLPGSFVSLVLEQKAVAEGNLPIIFNVNKEGTIESIGSKKDIDNLELGITLGTKGDSWSIDISNISLGIDKDCYTVGCSITFSNNLEYDATLYFNQEKTNSLFSNAAKSIFTAIAVSTIMESIVGAFVCAF